MNHVDFQSSRRVTRWAATCGAWCHAVVLSLAIPVAAGAAEVAASAAVGTDAASNAAPTPVLRQRMAAEVLQQPLDFEATADGRGMAARAGGHRLRIDAGGTASFADARTTIRLRLEGGDSGALPIGENPLPGRSNYLLGNDPSMWRHGVRQFSAARVKGIYPGIDLRYYGNGRQLEHDYLVAAGSDPSRIRMRVEGGAAHIDSATGNLVVSEAAREFLRLERPVAYQSQADGSHVPVKARFRHNKDGSFGLALGRFDRRRDLIVDPVVRYITYLGGNEPDTISDLQFDATGNVYVLMSTSSTDLKTTVEAGGACPAGCGATNTAQAAPGSSLPGDFYVAKFDPTGQTLLFATYVGGSSDDVAISLKVDTDGTVYLFGQSHSQDFPLVNAFNSSPPAGGVDGDGLYYYENVLTRLSADGSAILYSTYFGDGTYSFFQNQQFANHKLALGGNGTAYITGEVNYNSGSPGGSLGSFARGVSVFRTPIFSQGGQYVAKFDTTQSGDASLIYCTPVGADSDPTTVEISALGVDSQKNLWIYGTTSTSSFPTPTANAPQPQSKGAESTTFLLELNPAGTQAPFATFFGGSFIDITYDMELDSNDNIYVLLNTESTDYPLQNAADSSTGGNQWAMTRFAAGGTSVLYSTFLPDREEFSITATASGMVAVAGGGRGVPLKNNLAVPSGGTTFQVFDTNQSGDASLLASSYLGTPSETVNRVAFDYHDDLWLAGNAGANLPVVAPYQATCGADCNDGFIARVQLLTLAPSPINFPQTAVGASSAAQTATLSNQTLKTFYLTAGTLTDSADFTAASGCGGSLSPAASCTITFTFTPQSAGTTLTSTYTIADLDNPGEPLTVILNGTGTAPAGNPQPMLTPASLSFGSLTLGVVSGAQNATLSNSGTAPLTISGVAVSGGSGAFAATSACPASLAAGASCTIAVTCSPTASGTLTGTLAVSYPSPLAQQTVALSCSGVAPAAPQAALAAAAADFATVTVGATSAAQTFTLTNAGNADLPISSISLSGADAASFAIGTNTCTASLAAGSSCTIAVTFAPTAPGAASAALSVVDSVGTQTSALTGTGAAAPSDFGLSATPAAGTVAAGGSTSFDVDVTSAQGTFTAPVSLSASGLPPGATVSFSPASVTPGAAGATTTMTIDTATLSSADRSRSLNRVLAVPALALLLIFPIGARRRTVIRLSCTLAFVVIAAALQGCNGGFALPQAPAASQPQTYTVTITGTSGSTSHTTTVQLTVD